MLKDMGVTVVHPHQLPQTKFMDRKTWGGRASVKEQLLQMNAFAEGTQYLARLAGGGRQGVYGQSSFCTVVK